MALTELSWQDYNRTYRENHEIKTTGLSREKGNDYNPR